MPELHGGYAGDFNLADEAFCAGQLEATAKGRAARWQHWCAYVRPMGVDPYLQQVPFSKTVQCLTGFAARTRTGYYGKGQKVQSSSVTSTITAIGQAISLACNNNPTKVAGSDKFIPAIQVMVDGYTKANPPMKKMLPVEADVPKLLVKMGYGQSGSASAQAVGDLSLIAFYCLLCIGEYTVKGKWNESKQIIQFKLEDVTFFKKNKRGTLVCLLRNAPASVINTANSATLKLDNQKNGWKGVCVHQEANGKEFNCPVRALARWVIHLTNGALGTTLLLAVYHKNIRLDLTGEDISKGLKMAATLLQYPSTRGIPIACIDTLLLRSGSTNAWHYRDIQTHKYKKWEGGKGQHLKNTSGKNWLAIQQECQQT